MRSETDPLWDRKTENVYCNFILHVAVKEFDMQRLGRPLLSQYGLGLALKTLVAENSACSLRFWRELDHG